MVQQGAQDSPLTTGATVDKSLQRAKLYTAADMDAPDEVLVAGRRVAVVSQRSPGKETANEDSAAVIPWGDNAAVLVVADGLGGQALGEQASALAVRRIRLSLQQADPAFAMLRSAILNGIEAANRDVIDLGRGAATTLAVVELSGSTIRPYHVGDSGILAFGGRGKMKLQTTAHSPVGYGVEAGLIDESDAMHHEDRHVVSNVVGTPDLRIEIGPERKLAARDTLLLASDGLFDNLHLAEIVELARKGPVHKACEKLRSTARARMDTPVDGQPSKADDLTIVVCR
ncbi:protein phosphatase 2C domain-containing protein [Aeoliella sp. ICT_H6.2]|uniref:Protein phosphatase 2C domain-containing protein n=1 Tax=Aeoliella straminimaris TaxID=2954799 RepID=A0A9X2JKF8_9BACT|nr:protein phosphatase 2C domain-containing protein [Aeoliella straminimaris]MCO6046394.1 protein phosphatase 2C domain-containing protein [Aeoliella straminimaris]